MYHHHTQEEKQAAIELYITSSLSAAFFASLRDVARHGALCCHAPDLCARGAVRGRSVQVVNSRLINRPLRCRW